MLIAISDLHFRDLSAGGVREGQNIPAATALAFFKSISEWATEVRAREIVFLLVGDIFEFLRTELWFQSEARPYDDLEFSRAAVATLQDIMDRIESTNRRSLDIFRAVSRNDGLFLGFRFPVRPLFQYIPGNHDRYVHVVPELAARAGSWLGLQGPFPQRVVFPEYSLFARHGHEYDWLNCEYNFESIRSDVARDDDLYRYACLGDWLAIDIATRIPYELARRYPEEVDLYRAMVDIEDVRPVTSAFGWLRHRCDSRQWAKFKEAMRAALSSAFAMPIVADWIRSHRPMPRLDWTGLLQQVLIRVGGSIPLLPDSILAAALGILWSNDEDRVPVSRLMKDIDFARSGMKTLVHGHFHDSGVEFLDSGRAVVCPGGWRSRYTLSRNGRSYFKGKRLGYAIFYRDGERAASPHGFDLLERFSARGHGEGEGLGFAASNAIPDESELDPIERRL